MIDDFFNPGWPGVNEGLFRYWFNDGSLRPFFVWRQQSVPYP